MALSKGIGVRFSELRDNHESAPYWVWNRRDVRTYTRFGLLPNGESFGVARTPTQENYYARDVVIDRLRHRGRPLTRRVLARGCVQKLSL